MNFNRRNFIEFSIRSVFLYLYAAIFGLSVSRNKNIKSEEFQESKKINTLTEVDVENDLSKYGCRMPRSVSLARMANMRRRRARLDP